MIRTVRLALIASFVATLPAAAQQTRTLTGLVSSGEEGVPFAGAEVRLVGTDVRVCTNELGDFRLPVPATGEARIRITPVGFKPQEVMVEPGTSTVEVALGEHLFLLDEVRVTGYATTFDASRAAGNSIARLTAHDLENGAPAGTIESAMQGRVPGALIQANSGQPGGSYQITLRGINTILGSPDPMIIVDGVVISSAGFASGSNAVSGAGRVGAESAANRLADINPNDVDRIEVLRGPSASAMYGSKASNGVIIITTKQGHAPTREETEAAQVLECFIPGAALVQIR